jgi:hypothetical protein
MNVKNLILAGCCSFLLGTSISLYTELTNLMNEAVNNGFAEWTTNQSGNSLVWCWKKE